MTENETTRKLIARHGLEGQKVDKPAGGPRHYGCVVALIATDGNAFAVLERVSRILREHLIREGWSDPELAEEMARFRTDAMAGGYDDLLATCMKWVRVY